MKKLMCHVPYCPLRFGAYNRTSNYGKTNVMTSLLTNPNGLRFENVYLCLKSLHQPEYGNLRNVLQPTAIHLNSVIVLLDDGCGKQVVMQWNSRILIVFLHHKTYSNIFEGLFTKKVNLIITFNRHDLNLIHICGDHVAFEMMLQQIQEICEYCWEDKYSFMVIHKNRELNNGRFRKEFDKFVRM